MSNKKKVVIIGDDHRQNIVESLTRAGFSMNADNILGGDRLVDTIHDTIQKMKCDAIKTCPICGEEFDSVMARSTICSAKCFNETKLRFREGRKS